jgi:5'-deoxynucleotidase YfbR-like HD superfamily hydrolase
VAQHAVLVLRLVEEVGHPELALAALHYDSHEAYLCDIPKPLKEKISKATDVYHVACYMLDRAIAEAFGFELSEAGSQEQAIIKDADRLALLTEGARLLPDHGEALRRDIGLADGEYRDLAPLDDPLLPAEAQRQFLRAHEELPFLSSR